MSEDESFRGMCPTCGHEATALAELDDLKSVNARLRGLISGRDGEIGQLWEELWQEVDERNKMRADNVQLRERLKGSDMLAHVRGEQIERLRALVRSAYAEGFSEGMNEHTKFRGGKPWEDSRACRALEGK